MEIIKTEHSEMWVEEDILMIKISGTINAGEVEEIAKIGIDLADKFKNIKYNIVDISGIKNVPRAERESGFNYALPSYAATKLAFICKNPVARIIGSFFLRKYKLPLPAKLFSNIEEAKKWFKEGEINRI